MYRFLRLLIYVFVLAVIAIPVAWIALGWNPANPLRFRALSHEEPVFSFLEEGSRFFILEVRNTTSTPIRLTRGTVLGEDSNRPEVWLASVSTEWQIRDGEVLPDSHIVIPAHGVIHCTGITEEGRDRTLGGGGARITYEWWSAPKYRYGCIVAWLRAYLPNRLWEQLPRVSLSQDEAIFEVAPAQQK